MPTFNVKIAGIEAKARTSEYDDGSVDLELWMPTSEVLRCRAAIKEHVGKMVHRLARPFVGWAIPDSMPAPTFTFSRGDVSIVADENKLYARIGGLQPAVIDEHIEPFRLTSPPPEPEEDLI